MAMRVDQPRHQYVVRPLVQGVWNIALAGLRIGKYREDTAFIDSDGVALDEFDRRFDQYGPAGMDKGIYSLAH
jgi:hypothetical protein